MVMKILNFILFGFLLGINLSFAQQTASEPAKNAPQQTIEPVDLPTIFVKGQLLLNVNSGAKQDPEKPLRLTMEQLDSLNSLEKQQSLPIQIEAIPISLLKSDYKKGYLNADIGRFAVGTLNAGYGLNIEGYELFARGGIDFSDGHLNNAEYSKIYAKLSSDYIAPQKFFIFGGSRTKTELEYKNNKYKLYSVANPLERTVHNFDVDIDVDGNYSGVRFQTGFGFEALQLNTGDYSAANNNIMGFLKLHKLWNKFLLAGNLLLDFNYLRDNAANFIQIDGSAQWIESNISVNINGGFQLAGSSKGVDRGGLLLAGDIEYRIDKMFTLKGAIQSGLENRNWANFYNENPYISNSSEVDFAYNIVSAQAFFYFHPSDVLGLSIGGKFRISDRLPIFTNSLRNNGSFDLIYENANISKVIIEMFWNITDKDKFITNLTSINSSLTDKNSKIVPYMPKLKLSVDYNRRILENFGTTFGIDFIGERFADLENEKTLESYINIRAKFDYNINSYFSVYSQFDNLINQEIVIFDGYRERGMFINLGIMLQF